MTLALADATDASLDFLPLFPDETESTILERMRAWANEGLDPAVDVDLWVDTREGGHWHAAVAQGARELARLYDKAGTEVPMSGMVLWSWGSYLDDLAATWSVFRLAAVPAGGVVRFSGANGTIIAAGTTVSVEPVSEDETPPSFEVTTAGTIAGGHIDLPIQAVEAGAEGNVAANAITVPVTPLPGITLTNLEATTDGTDAETDEALVERLLEEFAGKGGGTKRDYRVWAREQPGVGRATVIAAWAGPGTVLVIVSAPDGKPASAETVEALQKALDPVPEQGEGKAPIGAIVTVQAAAVLNVTIAATINFEQGYSLDGAAQTVAMRSQLEEAVAAYIEGVQAGEEMVRAQVEGHMAVLPGVHDVGKVTINGVAGNVPVATIPPQAPALKELALTEGAP